MIRQIFILILFLSMSCRSHTPRQQGEDAKWYQEILSVIEREPNWQGDCGNCLPLRLADEIINFGHYARTRLEIIESPSDDDFMHVDNIVVDRIRGNMLKERGRSLAFFSSKNEEDFFVEVFPNEKVAESYSVASRFGKSFVFYVVKGENGYSIADISKVQR